MQPSEETEEQTAPSAEAFHAEPLFLCCTCYISNIPDQSLSIVPNRICLPSTRRQKIACSSVSQNETQLSSVTGFVVHIEVTRKKRVIRAGCGKVLGVWSWCFDSFCLLGFCLVWFFG